MSDENTIQTAENPVETMRKVMQNLGPLEVVTDPAPILKTAKIITIAKGREVVDLTNILRQAETFLKPAQRKGTARLSDLESLIDWANRFKGDTSVLFAHPDMTKPTLTCIADYHGAGAPDPISDNGDPTARHCHHRAIYDFPLSDEFKAWNGISDTPINKDELGEFIEANAKDIMDPTPSIIKGTLDNKNLPWENRLIETANQIEGRYGQLTKLLAMSKQFQVYETSALKIATNRDTGESEIQFLNEHKGADGKPMNIPNLIIIAIPIFSGGALYRMPVRFRYRKAGGTVKFILSIYNPEKAFKAAFDEAVNQATKETELPIFAGQPES